MILTSKVKIFAGVDPDLHTTGTATLIFVGDKLDIIEYELLKISPDLKGEAAASEMCTLVASTYWSSSFDLMAVEFPEVYRGNEKAKEAVALLDLVAGAALGNVEAFAVKPKKWKGNLSKKNHHPEILKRAGLTNPLPGYTKTESSHMIDAIGLAFYAYDEWAKQQLREKYKR